MAVEIDKTDAGALIEIVGDVCAMEAPLAQRRRFVMNRLCQLIEADYWTWGIAADLRPGALPAWVLHLHGGFDEGKFARFVKAQEHPDLARLTAPFAELLAKTGSHVTRLRQQTDPEDTFVKSGAYPIWAELDVAPGIMSCRPVDATTLSSITIHRRMSRPFFSERDARLTHILLSEVPWLHPHGARADYVKTVPLLSPRKRSILLLLVSGQSREQICGHLGLSVHTVNGYVKEIFAIFRVNSRAQLAARFLSGDGGDGLV